MEERVMIRDVWECMLDILGGIMVSLAFVMMAKHAYEMVLEWNF
jgi:hypothetical protein